MALELARTNPREPVAVRARRAVATGAQIARSWLIPLQGPYTSVLVTDDAGALRWMPVNQGTALSIGALYRALAVYGDLIGTLPVQRYRDNPLRPGDASERLPLPGFVEHPAGAPVGWTDEVGQILWSLLLRGNAYLVPNAWDFTGYPTGFWVADPATVEVREPESGVSGIEYRFRGVARGGGDLVFTNPTPDRLLHLRWQRPPGAFLGVGILDSAGGAGGTLQGAWWTERYASDVMSNPVPPAVLEHPLRLNKVQAEELQTQWADSIARARAIPAVLSGGIKYQPLAVNPRDVQLIESRKWNATQIATLFGLPPYLLGGSTGDSLTYSTVEGENTRLWTNALQPMCVRLERAIGGAWTPAGHRLRFVPDALLRSQTLDRYQAHRIALGEGVPFKTPDEVRSLENMGPLPTGPEPEVDSGGLSDE